MGGIGGMVMRQLTRTLTKKGIGKAMKTGKKMAGKRGKKGGAKKASEKS